MSAYQESPDRRAARTSFPTKTVEENTMPLIARRGRVLIALSLLFACAVAQEKKPAETAGGPATNAPAAKGEAVTELGQSVMYVFQAKNGDYWFGSNDRGVYRYDGKALVRFTTNDGLVSNRVRGIQEDKAGAEVETRLGWVHQMLTL